MKTLTILNMFNYGLVLIYGLFLSVAISGECKNRREQIFVLLLCPLFLLIQLSCWLIFGSDFAKRLYPFIVHMPLLLALVFRLKKPAGVALISICTAYLCCQLPKYGNIVMTALTGSLLAGEIAYTVLILPIYFLLRRFFVPAVHNAMTDSRQSLLLFGSIPVFYYLFDYATTTYTNLLYEGNRTLAETIPSILIIFYVAFLTAYRQQLQLRNQTQLQSSMLTIQLRQAEEEITTLRRLEHQSAVYRHDMRHHLAAIDGFLTAGKPQKAQEYIKGVQADIETITPKRFCKNELVNLICSSFTERAEQAGVHLTMEVGLPHNLTIPDTELCALLSNGLENALLAVVNLEENRRWISCHCSIRIKKLLIEIKNPYEGEIIMRDNLPISGREGHGYGCRSIQTIVDRNRGLCDFAPADGIFVLRILLPVQDSSQ